jgi:hypothetical protein
MSVPRPRTQIHPVMHPHQTLSTHRLPLEGRAEGGILKKEILIRSSYQLVLALFCRRYLSQRGRPR